MDREKLIKQLFVGKVAEIIGTEKTTELLKDATVVIDEMLKLRKADVINCVCPNEIKTGTVSIHCCNLCGKPDEDWWGKH
jgi:hypothetical protein